MKISISKEQYKTLLKLCYLGNWMVNSFRNVEDNIEEFNDIEQHIFRFYKDFECDDLIEYDEEHDEYFPTRAFEEDQDEIIDEYNDDSFWEELTERLADRDLFMDYGELQLRKMDSKQLFEVKYPYPE